jgi:cytochrome c oxidase subunit 2
MSRTSRQGVSSLATLLILCGVAGAASAEESERAVELYRNCQQCHGVEGHGDKLALAPAIAGLEGWYVETQLNHFRQGARGDNPQDIPGLRMRPMSRSLHSDEDVKLIAAFVAALPPAKPAPVVEGGDAQRGAATYQSLCAQCHGADGAGNQAMNAPRLRNTNDWYLVSALERYKAGIRGSNPKNPNGPLMRGMAMALADDQAIKDVVAYISTLNQQESK